MERAPSNVLLVTNEFPPDKTAGTATATEFLAEELGRRGVRVTVVVNTRRFAPVRETRGTVTVIRLRPADLPLTRMAQRTASLVGIVRGTRPQLIQGQSASCGALAVLAGRRVGVPTVTYVQGLDLYQSSWLARRTYIRWALRGSDRVVAVTDELRRRASELSGREASVIPHGLRVRGTHALHPAEARARLGLPQEARVVLFVGRLIALKGVHHLVRAMTGVAAACPDARLVIVGDGDRRADLTALVRSLALDGRVTFAGGQAHEDVIRFMRAADVFVLPSLVESFGIVLLEAMSCGLPVVASDVMGIPSIVAHGDNGILVPPGDEGALTRAVVSLLRDPARREALGRTNAAKALAYAWPRVADRFLALWADAVGTRGAGPSARPRGQVRRVG